ncbi:MAG: molybdenum cofactor carrier [Alphaproteobacteria bacterium]|nr:molybdenum cofactor carrier [Alphaproteobacteria bacterium]
MTHPVEEIVSGGQTGVDRAGLDAALALGLAAGGWCPRGRRAEDGSIPERYPLEETASAAYRVRTRLNVRDSDATLILCRGPLRGGTKLTADIARRMGRPLRIADLSRRVQAPAAAAWLSKHDVVRLNIAGPRESQAPGIGAEARRFLMRVLAP